MTEREKVIKEIERLCREQKIPYILFEDATSMNELLQDMRLGANIRSGLKKLNIPIGKEFLL